MRAAIMRGGTLVVDDVPDPSPGPGQILVRTVACGICGSDLHTLQHGDEFVEMSASAKDPGNPIDVHVMDLTKDVVMGHEYCAEVLELGENTGNSKVGDLVVSMPVTFDLSGVHPIGYSNSYPGGYGELMVLSDLLALGVPNGLSARHAALTEPMAVGRHAVEISRAKPGGSAIVLGCGPVGLAVIAALRQKGVEPIVATDFSPKRRELAGVMGAHEVIDPRQEPAVDAWRRVAGTKDVVIYEAVGVPGMLDDAIRRAPGNAQILVVGVCMETDHLQPSFGVIKELNIQFAFGYQPDEFSDTLRAIAEGEIDVEPLITGTVGVDGVPQAFADLADPEAHAKILVEPSH
jgi:threonine dehydrogenase-like Zn-dependent dehydrogenase